MLSLGLDRGAAWGVRRWGLWDGCSRLFLISLGVSAVLWGVTGPDQSLLLPQSTIDGDRVPRKQQVGMVMIWMGVALLGSVVTVLINGKGALLDAAGALLTHPLAEAFLFQGALLQLAARGQKDTGASSRRDLPFRAMLIVAFLQGLSQLQYWDTWSSAAMGQALRVLFLSFLFNGARGYWGSLWPVLAGYAINNGLAMYGGKPLGFHF
jgi:hypothetical protein